MKEWAPLVGKAKKPKSDKFYSDSEGEKEEKASGSSGSEDDSSSSSSSSSGNVCLYRMSHSSESRVCESNLKLDRNSRHSD